MYKSPIEIIYQEMNLQLEKCAKQLDDDIYKAVMHYAINVDEKELLRALNYDRNQYEKGYADGKADGKAEVMADIVLCKDCEYFTEHNDVRTGRHLRYGECHRLRGELFGDNDFCSYGERRDGE